MKRFLLVDGSGRGWAAQWSENEIRDDIARGDAGTFAEFDAEPDDDDTGAERLSDWVGRCSPGDEFRLDASLLVCIDDDSAAVGFDIVETRAGGVFHVVDNATGEVVAEVSRMNFRQKLGDGPADIVRKRKAWETFVALIQART
jgi:hypothetical protein